jgi:hypothetical protein
LAALVSAAQAADTPASFVSEWLLDAADAIGLWLSELDQKAWLPLFATGQENHHEPPVGAPPKRKKGTTKKEEPPLPSTMPGAASKSSPAMQREFVRQPIILDEASDHFLGQLRDTLRSVGRDVIGAHAGGQNLNVEDQAKELSARMAFYMKDRQRCPERHFVEHVWHGKESPTPETVRRALSRFNESSYARSYHLGQDDGSIVKFPFVTPA